MKFTNKEKHLSVMNSIKISIIIPVFNNLGFTKKCLKNLDLLCMQDPKLSGVYSIVLIDDGSTDGTFSWVKENYPDVYVLQGNGNLWWGGGINMGMRFALETLKTDYLLWWNNDIVSDQDYFINLYGHVKNQSEHTIIGSKIIMLHNGLIWGMGGKFDAKTGKKFMYGHKQTDAGDFQKPFEVDWFPGMGTTFHRSVFEDDTYVDALNFPQYHGDSDFTFRAKKKGYTLMAFPDLVLYNDNLNTGLSHKGSFRQLTQSLTSIKSNFNVKKNILFLQKHAESPRAYIRLVRLYYAYLGGFLKWKVLNALGIYKSKP